MLTYTFRVYFCLNKISLSQYFKKPPQILVLIVIEYCTFSNIVQPTPTVAIR